MDGTYSTIDEEWFDTQLTGCLDNFFPLLQLIMLKSQLEQKKCLMSKFYFKISLAYICLLFPFYSRTIMAQLKVSKVQRFVKFCEQNNHDFYLYVRFC